MAGNAGRSMSIESATSAGRAAISETNSPKPIGDGPPSRWASTIGFFIVIRGAQWRFVWAG